MPKPRTPFTPTCHSSSGEIPPDPRVIVRPQRPGPEAELVNRYLDSLRVRCPRGCSYSVFVEPKLECGVPDIVIAVWNPGVAKSWEPSRRFLTSQDFRVLQCLQARKGATDEELASFFPRAAPRSVERLHVAGLIRRVRGTWLVRSPRRTVALRRLIAIEAKMTDWRKALEQAWRNTWFATDSYVLLPDGRDIPPMALPPGVRQCTAVAPEIDARCASGPLLPLCYATWLFNEWVWRMTQPHGDANDD